MCSVDETENDEFLTETLKLNNDFAAGDRKCGKCQEKAALILHGKDFICQSCLMTYCTHKFRSTIGKSHVVKHGDKILIAFSGGAASTAMLHMILQGLSDKSHKRIRFYPSLIYIHETSGGDINENENEILQKMIASNLPCYVTSLDMYFRNHVAENETYATINADNCKLDPMFNDSKKLDEALASLQSLSSKEDFVKHSRLRLLSQIGKSLAFDKIFVGDTSSVLAVEMLAGISLGRGSQIPNYVGFVDVRYDIPILRPLREFQSKEISLYNHYSHLISVTLPTLSTKTDMKGSINKLTETFVNKLQEDFPATIPTIFRTGDKICSTVSNSSFKDEKCALCLSVLDTSISEKFSALEALLLSQKLCQSTKENDNVQSCDSPCSCGDPTAKERLKFDSRLCYACRCLAREVGEASVMKLLPADTMKKIERTDLRKEIEEFLL